MTDPALPFQPAAANPDIPPAYDTGPPADQLALARMGTAVRARLAADPSAYRIPTDAAELYAVAGFLSPGECKQFMALVDKVARPSATFDPAAAVHRTSYSGDVDAGDPFVRMIERRIDPALAKRCRASGTPPGRNSAPTTTGSTRAPAIGQTRRGAADSAAGPR